MEQTHDLFRRTLPTPQTWKAQPSESASAKMPWLNASCLRSSQMRATCVCDGPTAKMRWDGHAEELGQPGQGDSRREGVSPENPLQPYGGAAEKGDARANATDAERATAAAIVALPKENWRQRQPQRCSLVQQTSPRPTARMPPTCRSSLWRRTCPGS